MRLLTLSAFCLAAALPIAAQADNPTANGVALVGSGKQGATFSSTSTVQGGGSAVGSSASGTNFKMTGEEGGSRASFKSSGQATSTVSVTPYSVTASSSHEAFSSGHTSGGGSFTADNQTFGQSNGASYFSGTQTTNQSEYANIKYKLALGVGFASFEGAFAGFGGN